MTIKYLCLNNPINCYRPQTKFAKVVFLHLSVILFTGWGVSASVHVGYTAPSRADTPWSRHPLGADIPPVQCLLGDTGNKRAVRIPLECIFVLVVYLNSFMQQWIKKLSRRRPRSKKFTKPLLAAIFLVIHFYRISEDGLFEPLLNQLLLLRLFF